MAKLPSAEVLGAAPSAASGRQISSIDGSAYGQGLESLAAGMRSLSQGQAAQAQGFENMGRGIAKGIDAVAAEAQRHDQINETLLDGKRNIERMKLAEQIEAEKNPDRIAELKSGFAKIDENFAGQIKDPVRRQLVTSKWGEQTQRSVVEANTRQRQFYQQSMLDGANNIIEEQRRKAVSSNDPVARKEAIDSVHEQMDKLFRLGVIPNEEQLKAQKRKFADTFAVDRYNMQSARDRYEASQPVNIGERSKEAFGFFQSKNWSPAQAAGIVGNLIQESKLSSGALNPGDGRDGSDSIGVSQWNSTRATALKSFAAANGSDWRDFKTQLAFVQRELDTSESTAAKKLREAQTPREAAAAFAEYFLRPAGSGRGTPQAIDGWANRARHAEAVASQFAGMKFEPTEADNLFRMMPPERQVKMREDAERDYHREVTEQRQATQRIETEWKADFDIRQQNATTAAVETGTLPKNAPTTDDFIRRYGEVEGKQKAVALQEAQALGQNIIRVGQMSDEQAKVVLAEAKPRVDDPAYATKQKSYELLAKAYEADRKARDADPVAYVQTKFPELARAWADVDAKDPAAIAPLMARTNALQQQLGIPADKRALLPKAVVDRTLQIFKDDTIPQEQRLSAVQSLVFSTSDPEQQRAVMQQLDREGVPGKMRAVFSVQARGDMGAARRLASAAMADPKKLEIIDNKVGGPQVVDREIASQIFEKEKIGDAVYGLSAGLSENTKRATDDMELMRAYVRNEVINGKSVTDAVKAGIKDLYGNVKVYAPRNAMLALPENEDTSVIGKGLSALEPSIKSAINARAPQLAPDAKPADREAHRIATARFDRLTSDMLANGEWRSFGKGIAFIDKTTGLAVSGTDGKPLVYTLDQVKEAAKVPATPSVPAAIPDMTSTGPDQTAVSIAQEARQRMKAQQPVQSSKTFGGSGTVLQ